MLWTANGFARVRGTMEDKGSAARVPEVDLALWRRRREMGGALIVAGSASWLVHSVLMMVGLVGVFSISLTTVFDVQRSVLVSLLSFIGAIIAVLFATFLIGAGLLLYRTGIRDLSWKDWYTGEARFVSKGTRSKGGTAAAFVLAYGILGSAVIGIYAVSLSTVSGFQSALNAMILILLLWMVASILLIIGAAFVSSFLRSLRTEAVSTEAFGGGGFLGYAITNAIGVFLFAGPLFIILLSPSTASPGLLIAIVIGAVMVMIAVPIAGIVVFSFFIVSALRLRRLQPGRRPAIGLFTSTPTMPPSPSAPRPSSQVVASSPPPIGNPSAVPAAGPSWRGIGNVPPPPPLEGAVANPAAAVIVPPPPPPEDPTWMLRLQAQIESLEKAMNSRIDELEQAIAEAKDKLSGKPAGKPAGKPEPEPSEKPADEFDSL